MLEAPTAEALAPLLPWAGSPGGLSYYSICTICIICIIRIIVLSYYSSSIAPMGWEQYYYYY